MRRIARLDMNPLDIPFKAAFAHAAAVRECSGAVLAVARSTDGMVGMGEGCPREYVSGETQATALAFFERIRTVATSIRDIEELKDFVHLHRYVIDANPAAWCAIETAVIDCLARDAGLSVEQLLQMPDCAGEFRYSAVLGVASRDAFEKQLQSYLAQGFIDFKVKLSGIAADDLTRLALLADLPNLRVRLDANNLWRNADVATDYLRKLPGNFWAIEEPLGAGNLAGCRRLAERLGVRVILDESFLVEAQLDALYGDPTLWVPNLRVSKMGGLLRSLRVLERGVETGLQFILGAQVGESTILTRLALVLAKAYGMHILAQEGAFGTHLLAHDITSNPLMFGSHGILNADFRCSVGLGIDYDQFAKCTSAGFSLGDDHVSE